MWIGIFVVFVVVSIALVLVPIVGSLAHTVLTPVFAGGVMLGCHALARGEPLRIGHLFEGFQGGRFAPLCILGLLALAMLFIAATVMVATIFLTLGASGLAALMDFGNATFDYQAMATAGAAMLVVALIGATLAVLVAMAYWFAPALVVLNGEPPIAALQKSFAASLRNIGAFLLYGLVYGTHLGLGGPRQDMAALMTLNQNGQGLSLSRQLAEHGATDLASLAKLIRREPRGYTFAQTFPTGTHAMWLYYWLACAGVHPFKDVKTIVVPPPRMAASARAGAMDGFRRRMPRSRPSSLASARSRSGK